MPDGNGSGATAARQLLEQAWRVEPRRFSAQLVLLGCLGVVGGANVALLIPIVNGLADPSGNPGGFVGGWAGSLPVPLLLALAVVLTAAQAGLQYLSATNSAVLNHRLVDGLRGEAFGAVLDARWDFVLSRRRSDIVSVISTGAMRCGAALSQLLAAAVTGVLALVTAVVALVVQPQLAVVAVLGSLTAGLILATSMRPAYRVGGELGARMQALQGVLADSLDSLRLVRAHDAATIWRGQLETAFLGTRAAQVAQVHRSARTAAISQTGTVAGAAVLVLVAISLRVPAPTIVVVLLLTARLAGQLQSLAASGQLVAYSLPAVQDITELTTAARAAAEQPAEDDDLDLSGPGWPLVRLIDVGYTYPNSGNGVHGLSFDLPAGQVTALTGPSGAGKSTTADLVLGLLQPASGEVLVSGVPLTAEKLKAWRRQVAYVPQESIILPGTLRENLSWSAGRPVSDEDCREALRQASARFAADLPEGLDTRLGDGGLRLSGGERQRVSIARALLRRPALLVLDEATSALDDEVEAEVLDVLAGLVPEVTVLVIAHRRSTLARADRVVRLRAGELAGPVLA